MKENGLSGLINKWITFPIVYNTRGNIIFKFIESLSPINNKVEIILYEYINNKPIKRHKSHTYARKGFTFSFNTIHDFYVLDDTEYVLEITYYNISNIEVKDCVFIKIN